MSYCAVCNGTEQSTAECPRCGSRLEDHGRFNDFLGPYSPYRPIDDISMTNGFLDIVRHECIHVMSCPACSRTYTIGFAELG
jgi:primosomal protein N'